MDPQTPYLLQKFFKRYKKHMDTFLNYIIFCKYGHILKESGNACATILEINKTNKNKKSKIQNKNKRYK